MAQARELGKDEPHPVGPFAAFEDLREVISAYQNCVAGTVGRFGGFVAKYMGDGVLVYFGYPQAHEDDAERAVRAGLELIAAVGALRAASPLQTRVGIATGLVVVGDLIGSGAAQEQAVVGETPNLAARLQSIAEPNMVVIAESTRRLLRREEIKLQVALITPLMHVKRYAAEQTKAAAEQARLLIEQAEALGEPPEDPLLLFSVLYAFWVENYVAFNGDAMRDFATQFLGLAEKQRATGPLMIGHRLMGASLLLTGYIAAGRRHLDQAIALYDPAEHRPLATRFGQDVGVMMILSIRALDLWLLGYPDAAHRANKALSVTVTDSTLRDSPDTGCVIGTTGNTNEADRVVTDATVNPAVSTTEEKSQVEPGVPGPSAKPALSVEAWPPSCRS